ncbi:putative glycoside hydrolase family 17 [Phaeomoniella chlamydospora]|uniref:Probable glucan endo-1,3-beta-glucosidase eglC n=1 Tax=Phaeomoniella chlamydospora TaxID=158046 RepID=A0A0G2GRE2_PHACM|nr:putative glycoside hydrolase family 17 [Phaeomoniella chlamydospora]
MHFIITASALLLSILPSSLAYYTGFNIAANKPDGSCRSQSEWESAFTQQRNMPQGFATVRLYASSDCDTLANAVPAALATDTYILAGVWTEDSSHYEAEKQALLNAINTYGYSWLIGVSVGSEDLYRSQSQNTGETTPSTLAQQIYDVRGMLTTVGISSGSIPIGHVDTWTAWVDSQNTEVIAACDFVGTDGYPYWQSTSISDAATTFWDSVNDVRSAVDAAHPGIWVWITETGWPVSGDAEGAATPSTENLQSYWKSVGCQAFDSAHTFWYTLDDWNASPSFGVIGEDGEALIDFTC